MQVTNISATVAPNPPLASYSDGPSASSETQKNVIPTPWAAHTATSTDSTIYVFGGRPPSSATSVPLSENGTIHALDAINHSWSTPTPHQTRRSSDFPCPRTYASSSSIPHPLSSGDYGTIFLHGGYDSKGKQLRDVWTFDVTSRMWSQRPDIPALPQLTP
jgi:hypothetical protein